MSVLCAANEDLLFAFFLILQVGVTKRLGQGIVTLETLADLRYDLAYFEIDPKLGGAIVLVRRLFGQGCVDWQLLTFHAHARLLLGAVDHVAW